MNTSLKDKWVFITGASTGFGAEGARLFAREGAHVVIGARRMDRLEAVAALAAVTPGVEPLRRPSALFFSS